ncbi:nuclear transport factor 2 family protein [Sphingobium sp.]|uniref:nuclear transport factor 2 family protein n=1 Tax=Sphingobium sp. TaxID=1912891 RepID=UPI0028BF4514|nr:nuclear transport factor 2 family protein [Sphingobium sp.]
MKAKSLLMAATLLAMPLAPAPAAAKALSNVEKAAEALQINNIMGRYSLYVIANQWLAIGDMFALDEPDVRQNVPTTMEGPAVRDYFRRRAAEPLKDGVMHQHSFLAPIIEVAGDGQTAKGVWDSPGIDVGDGDTMANWAWVRYAVDFKKTPQGWKIWHMRVLPVWKAPYGDAWSQMVRQSSAGKKSGGANSDNPAARPAQPAPRPAAMAGLPPAGTEQKWRYNGLGAPPVQPLKPPVPYQSFDPADAY